MLHQGQTCYSCIYNYLNFYWHSRFWFLGFTIRNNLFIYNRISNDPQRFEKLPWVVVFSVILTVFSYYVFTKFFYIDLPDLRMY